MRVRERKQAVLAMEMLVRSVNNEPFIDSWLSCGVPDGDIQRYEEDEVDEYFTEDKNFSELMGLFLSIMSRAHKNGGLYIDGIKSRT